MSSTNPPDPLAAWLELEAAILQRVTQGPGAGVVQRSEVAGSSGLHLMQRMLNGELPYPAMAEALDFLLVEVEQGRAVFQGKPGPRFFNPMGGIHGGWYASLLDSAMGCAVHSLVPPGRGYATAELSVNLVRAIGPKVRRVRAEGKVLHAGRQMSTAEGKLVGCDGTLYAHGTTTCLVFDLPPVPAAAVAQRP